MNQGEKTGVKGGPADYLGLFGSIEEVPGEGEPQMGQMNTNLVGAPGLQLQQHQGTGAVRPQSAVAGDGGGPVLPYLPPEYTVLRPANGGADDACSGTTAPSQRAR